MLVRTVLLTCLLSVAGRFRSRDTKKLPFHGSAAVVKLLEVTTERFCSIISITDDSASFFAVAEEIWETWRQQRGTAMFQVKAHNQNTNMTHRLSQLVSLARQVRQSSSCTTVLVVSHDPAFLAAFAERYGCVWYTYLPYTPNGGKIEMVAAWTPSRGLYLSRKILPFPEKFLNFHGTVLNVTALPYNPFWMEDNIMLANGTSVIKYDGTDYRLLMMVAAALNFTVQLLYSESWDDVTKQVEERVSFICPAYHIMMTVRYERYDFTYTYEFSYFSFAMAKPSQEPQWQSLYYPLTDQVWLAVLAALLSVPTIYISIEYVQRNMNGQTTGGGAVFQDMAGMLLGQSLLHRLSSNHSSRVLVTAWIVFALIVGVAYRGNLTASLTLPKYPSRPETLPQLVDTVERITVPPFGITHVKYYSMSESPLFNALAKLMEVGPSLMEGLQGALQHNRAHLGGSRYLKYQIADMFTDMDGTSRLYVGRENLYPGASGWPIPHDAPYKVQLDYWIMTTIEAGLYEKWMADLLRETTLKSRQKQRKRQNKQQDENEMLKQRSKALTIIHTQGAFILSLLGLYVAFVVIIGELLVSRITYTVQSY
ncbi:hypothetical protein O3P69_004507 [Scylla paramamosain]|uniref:Ionotropic glutamate receptor C-terminal domain-containing protein n=1 Tax=Scylla paramamosain TaxID=85552 RepID=A0AAW0UD75_SCYPA